MRFFSLYHKNLIFLYNYYIKNEDCKGRDVLAVKGGAQLKRVCVLTPKGDIGPHSGVAEQLFCMKYLFKMLIIFVKTKNKHFILYENKVK